ncbi:Nitrite reductase [NAD(P)H] [compost metagenome]
MERTSDWVERTGLDWIKQAILEDEVNRKLLNERVRLALAQVKEPWQEVIADPRLRETVYGNYINQ